MKTKLFILLPVKPHNVPWDKFDGHVVRAASETEARVICPCMDEGKTFWTDPGLSTCELLTLTGDPGIILSSCLNG